ncbi:MULTISPECIES: arginyltransferase [unclassified Motilimonas]|uniref:arginyltransferase n=1 Tax=unclassified Motilimonas TaxID=2643697 RepID=UPI001E5B8E66|nr:MULTISPECIES: arginyltransferase [unclassified Motilimonas]MCE0556416.1 arginyltransferase [Motilimonas sp. E26]MDO6525814.1 arginyltransferase [Motilimonas sp. 1_MG-2023]
MLDKTDNSSEIILKVGLTPEHTCSYLPEKKEQLLVMMDPGMFNPHDYERLLSLGFRRSGKDIYRPHCRHCQQCQSIRLPVNSIQLTKSQKRVVKKNQAIVVKISHQNKPEYFELYKKYINTRHQDGSMYPADLIQYEQFVLAPWLSPHYLEFYDHDTLIAVAVTDVGTASLSAMYTFFHPDFGHLSLGTFAILQQLSYAKSLALPWLYLGYQVDDCEKMNYKTRFSPYERLIRGDWHKFTN